MSELGTLTDPSGNPIADDVYRGEDVYEGPYLEEGPDIVIDQAPHVHISGDVGRDVVFGDPLEDGWKGENKREALFAASGPEFSTGTVNDFSILDLAPTLLHLHGIAVPKDMDGTVRKDIFRSGSEPMERDIAYQDVPESAAEIRRIREVAQTLDL